MPPPTQGSHGDAQAHICSLTYVPACLTTCEASPCTCPQAQEAFQGPAAEGSPLQAEGAGIVLETNSQFRGDPPRGPEARYGGSGDTGLYPPGTSSLDRR